MSKKLLVTAAAVAALMTGSQAMAAGHSIKIGLMATLEGTYTVLGEDGVRGAKTALAAFGGKAGGKEIELVIRRLEEDSQGSREECERVADNRIK